MKQRIITPDDDNTFRKYLELYLSGGYKPKEAILLAAAKLRYTVEVEV